MQRRKFLKNTALAAAGISALQTKAVYSGTRGKSKRMFIGTPVLPEFLYENGIADSLDEMQEWCNINTVMTFSHDHVFNQYEQNFEPKKNAKGEAYTNTWVHSHAKYYEKPDYLANDHKGLYAGRDILDELHEEAAPRKMDVYARILEPYVITGAIPGFKDYAEVDANGEKRNTVCFNHPGYMAYWDSVMDDLVYSHPYLAGFKYGQERGGPILSSMGKNRPSTCFCEHCIKLAKKRDINIEKARRGLIAIQEYGNRINAGEKAVDGNFVTFLRILIENPDVLSWEQFWMDSREGQKKRMYRRIKSIDENIQVGWHMDHGLTWDLITRATWDYSKMGPYSDWLSIALYFDSMGRRSMGHYDRNYRDILFGDAAEKYSYPMYLSMLGYDPDKQPPLKAHRRHDTSFTSDYLYQESKRVMENISDDTQVLPRPGFDMPGYDCNVKPEEVKAAVRACLKAGVHGFWVGREWDELREENARAFGEVLREEV